MKVDPRSYHNQGIFVVPKQSLKYGNACFDSIYIAHSYDDYKDTWYDAIDMDEEVHTYSFSPPKADGNLYITVETYPYDVVPVDCD